MSNRQHVLQSLQVLNVLYHIMVPSRVLRPNTLTKLWCHAESPGLVYALSHYGSPHPDQLAPYRQDLLAFYCESAIGSKTPVSAEKLAAWSPLVAHITQQEFSSTILPAMLKYVKRTPEAALVSIKAFLSAVQLNLSSSAPEMLDQWVKLVRGSKESVR